MHTLDLLFTSFSYFYYALIISEFDINYMHNEWKLRKLYSQPVITL